MGWRGISENAVLGLTRGVAAPPERSGARPREGRLSWTDPGVPRRVASDGTGYRILSWIAFQVSRRMGRRLESELEQVIRIAEGKLANDGGPLKTDQGYREQPP